MIPYHHTSFFKKKKIYDMIIFRMINLDDESVC